MSDSKYSKIIIAPLVIIMSLFCTAIISAEVVWSDEFDGTNIDLDKWAFDVGTGDWGWGNGELEYYTSRSDNAYVEDGSLVIQAIRENYNGSAFTSARLKTKGRMSFTYGTLEARIKIPDLANGLWPAFWLLGDNVGSEGWPKCGEIDILEMGMAEAISAGVQNRRHSSGAFWDYQGNLANYAQAKNESVDLNNDYHIYKLKWTPNGLTSYVDNVQCWGISIDNPEEASLEEFHRPFHILLNLAVGGQNFVQITDPGAITAPLPAKMYVDWIRITDDGDTQLFANDVKEQGNFGIFTETTPIGNQVNYGTDAELYIWNNMSAISDTPYEGEDVWSFDIGAGNWWGMGVFCTEERNMKNYSDGYLHLNMKMTNTQSFRIGASSSGAGEGWVTFDNSGEQYGLVRDGAWHEVLIPLNLFGNVDFLTINQIFMIAGDGGAAFNIAIDDVYWIESVPGPTPANGNFGLLTETAAHMDAGAFEFVTDGEFYVWENTLVGFEADPYEGEVGFAFQSAPGLSWFGAAFTPKAKYNLTAFRYPESRLHFAMKTSSTTTFQIGMKSGNIDGVGQKWIIFQNGSDPYGFVRDGSWHEIDIPMSDITTDVDLSQVSQLFEILGVDGPIGPIEIDDICFTGGGEPIVDEGENQLPTITITSPASGAYYAPDSDIDIEVDATDSDGYITKVEFFESDNLIASITSEPFTLSATNIAEGTYFVKARAADDRGGKSYSNTIEIHVRSVPGDITGDGQVNVDDLSILASYWLKSDCTQVNDFCQKADVQPDGKVNLLDLSFISEAWMN